MITGPLETIEADKNRIEAERTTQATTIFRVIKGELKGNRYTIIVYPPWGKEDTDDLSQRFYTILDRGVELLVDDISLLEAHPIEIDETTIKRGGLTKDYIDGLAEELFEEAKKREIDYLLQEAREANAEVHGTLTIRRVRSEKNPRVEIRVWEDPDYSKQLMEDERTGFFF